MCMNKNGYNFLGSMSAMCLEGTLTVKSFFSFLFSVLYTIVFC